MALKTALLQILEEHRDAPVSGQALADRLHVSRAAVWKAMKALQAEGHRITAVTNRGYQLERDSDVLTPQGIRCRLRPGLPGLRHPGGRPRTVHQHAGQEAGGGRGGRALPAAGRRADGPAGPGWGGPFSPRPGRGCI